MEVKQIFNKETQEPMTTQEGKPLVELRFQPGDEFIPLFDSIKEDTKPANVKGTVKNITNYKLKCKVRDSDGNTVVQDGENELFVTLTPGQAKSMNKKVEEDPDFLFSQHLWVAYSYESEDFGPQIGVGLKKKKLPPKDFADFDSVEE